MGRMPRLVERGKKDRRLGEPREVSWEEIEALELDPRVELIRQLIPLGLAEVGRMLEEEVEQLAGQHVTPGRPRTIDIAGMGITRGTRTGCRWPPNRTDPGCARPGRRVEAGGV